MAEKEVQIDLKLKAEEAVAKRVYSMLQQKINSLKLEVVKLSRNNNDRHQVCEEIVALLVHTGSSLHVLDMNDLYSMTMRQFQDNSKHPVPVYKNQAWNLAPDVAEKIGIKLEEEENQPCGIEEPHSIVVQKMNPSPAKPVKNRKRKMPPTKRTAAPRRKSRKPALSSPGQLAAPTPANLTVPPPTKPPKPASPPPQLNMTLQPPATVPPPQEPSKPALPPPQLMERKTVAAPLLEAALLQDTVAADILAEATREIMSDDIELENWLKANQVTPNLPELDLADSDFPTINDLALFD